MRKRKKGRRLLVGGNLTCRVIYIYIYWSMVDLIDLFRSINSFSCHLLLQNDHSRRDEYYYTMFAMIVGVGKERFTLIGQNSTSRSTRERND